VSRREPVSGDVVQVNLGATYGLYRIVGVGGQTVEIKGKRVSVDGISLEGSVAQTALVSDDQCRSVSVPTVQAKLGDRVFQVVPGGEDMAIVVPKNGLFLLGDHRQSAGDSRTWGPISVDAVEGVATRVLWSSDDCISSVRWRRIWNSIE
jgi:signal peptidase I